MARLTREPCGACRKVNAPNSTFLDNLRNYYTFGRRLVVCISMHVIGPEDNRSRPPYKLQYQEQCQAMQSDIRSTDIYEQRGDLFHAHYPP
jgi:hypothetical protein